MGSRAFAGVARAVLFVIADPENETTRLLGQPKNNLGSTDDLSTLAFKINGAHVADTDEGPVWTGRVQWLGESPRTIRDVLESAAENADTRSATADAAEWLVDRLTNAGGTDEHAAIQAAARKAGHSVDAVKRARNRLGVTSESLAGVFPRRTFWTLPGTAVDTQ
jgi:hypothetical protein